MPSLFKGDSMEPYVFTRKFKRYDGTRCTIFKPESYVPLEPGKEYYITVRRYGEPVKAGFKKVSMKGKSGGVMFIIPRMALNEDEHLYQVEVYDPSDEEALKNGCLIGVADDGLECIEMTDVSRKHKGEENHA